MSFSNKKRSKDHVVHQAEESSSPSRQRRSAYPGDKSIATMSSVALPGHQTPHETRSDIPHPQQQLQHPSGDISRQHATTEVGLLEQNSQMCLSNYIGALQRHNTQVQSASAAGQQLLLSLGQLIHQQNSSNYAQAASLPLALRGAYYAPGIFSPDNVNTSHSSYAAPNQASIVHTPRALATTNADLPSFSINKYCALVVNQQALVNNDTRSITPQEIHQRLISNITSGSSHQDTGSQIFGPSSSSIRTQVAEGNDLLDYCNDHNISKTPDIAVASTCGRTNESSAPTGQRKRSLRTTFPLGIMEDPNWLSEFHCFIRSELVEVFQASPDDVNNRRTRKALSLGQVGIRCRFCSVYDTDPKKKKAGRSMAFPSSLQQIYQSMIMMIREHFKDCPAIPDEIKRKFCKLQEHGSSRAQESKSYWVHSAMKLGMRDSDPKSLAKGIVLVEEDAESSGEKPTANDQTMKNQSGGRATLENDNEASLSTSNETKLNDPSTSSYTIEGPTFLVEPADRRFASEFLFNVMSQFVVCNTVTNVIIGKCRMPSGEYVVPTVNGLTKEEPARIGCQHCVKKGGGYYGAAQLHVRRKFHLPDRVLRMVDHLKRCTRCPDVVKNVLKHLEEQNDHHSVDYMDNKIFYDRVWTRLKTPSVRKKKKK